VAAGGEPGGTLDRNHSGSGTYEGGSHVKLSRWLVVPAAALLLVSGETARAADKTPGKEIASFGSLQTPTPEAAKAQAAAWYARVGGKDMAKFNAIWSTDRPTLDKVADTLALGDPEAAKILKHARDAGTAAPEGVPALIRDKKADVYLRSNLGLAYAKALANRRIFEEVQLTLQTVKGENVVDPAVYFFNKAVAEYSLMARPEASAAITRLIEDVEGAPERYRMVAALMQLDMLTWQDDDLGWVARKMNVIADRLDINRGGDKTRRMQKEVLVRLEEMVKEKENQQKQQSQGQGQGNGGQCPPGSNPSGGQPGNNPTSSSPQQDSYGGNAPGKGEINEKEKTKVTENWGNLPEKDRAKAMIELTRDLPREMKESVDIFIKKLGERDSRSADKDSGK
jgi:hypothetical protein